MAITHNLSDITSIVSCYDPVSGISGTVGNSWLLWRVFTALQSFDSNIKIITNSSPTPTFLRSYPSTLISTPAQNRVDVSDYVNFYMANDPGLSQTPQSAIVYKWKIEATSWGNVGALRAGYIQDGGSMYELTSLITNGNVDSPHLGAIYGNGVASGTTTNMTAVPLVLFWKSDNANLLMGIDRTSGAIRGMVAWFNPAIQGYRVGVGAITEGLNARAIAFINGNTGHSFIIGGANVSGFSVTALVSGLSPLNSIGTTPSFLLGSNLIAGKLRFGYNGASVKLLSDEVDGIALANNSVVGVLPSIQLYSKYYLCGPNISDGRESHRVLFELGT